LNAKIQEYAAQVQNAEVAQVILFYEDTVLQRNFLYLRNMFTA